MMRTPVFRDDKKMHIVLHSSMFTIIIVVVKTFSKDVISLIPRLLSFGGWSLYRKEAKDG